MDCIVLGNKQTKTPKQQTAKAKKEEEKTKRKTAYCSKQVADGGRQGHVGSSGLQQLQQRLQPGLEGGELESARSDERQQRCEQRVPAQRVGLRVAHSLLDVRFQQLQAA